MENFQVLESYNDLAAKAASAKGSMQSLARESVTLRETLDHLETALADEAPPDPSEIEKVYESVGVELPGVTLRRLDAVKNFYSSVVRNRKYHLGEKIDEIKNRLNQNILDANQFDQERQGILKTLDSHGALADFVSLQKEFAELEANAATSRERFKAAELLEREKTQLDIDRGNLHHRLQQDFKERKAILDKAILLVTGFIGELYDDRSGRFEIAATDRGPDFKISIEGDRGGGIASMEIFCLDLALFRINSERLRAPGFLLHDSHLFDGVDERQIALALELGARAANEFNAQYIVTMNSDIFDRLPLSDHVDREDVVLATKLSDQSESGGLFGFRFG